MKPSNDFDMGAMVLTLLFALLLAVLLSMSFASADRMVDSMAERFGVINEVAQRHLNPAAAPHRTPKERIPN